MNTLPWQIIFTSAAVAAVVSSLATLVGQYFERRARRRELLLTKSIELAKSKNERMKHISKTRPVVVYDDIVMAESYFQWLEHLFDHGALPDHPQIQRPKLPAEGVE